MMENLESLRAQNSQYHYRLSRKTIENSTLCWSECDEESRQHGGKFMWDQNGEGKRLDKKAITVQKGDSLVI